MKRLVVAALPVVLASSFAAHAEPLAPLPVLGLPQWHWNAPSTLDATLRIDLIRADVTIVPSNDSHVAVTIVAQGSAEDAARLWIDVTEKDGGYVLSDRFPRRTMLAFPKECLPQPDERGDFWLVSTKLRVTVAAPSAWLSRVSVTEGSVHDLRPTVRTPL
jgi:hypothetical protein